MPADKRNAATLIEVLVAVGVVGALVALLLGAVQSARSAAAALSCANNLRQIGLGLHSHHDAVGKLPPAVRGGPAPGALPFLSWRARLLPYVEQSQLWDQTITAYRGNQNPFFGAAFVGREKVMSLFTCPADGRLRSVWIVNGLGGDVRTALTSYLGVSGTDSWRHDGVIFKDSAVSINEILDGASQTIMVGERPPSVDLYFGWWYVGAGQRGTGASDAELGVRELNSLGRWYHGCDGGPYAFEPRQYQDNCSAFSFWSLHRAGAYFLFGDGSVRLLRYEANSILPALATRAGGEVALVVE